MLFKERRPGGALLGAFLASDQPAAVRLGAVAQSSRSRGGVAFGQLACAGLLYGERGVGSAEGGVGMEELFEESR